MGAGKYRHRVTIQRLTTTQDAEGITVETWTNVATVWAAIEDLSGREYLQAQAVTAAVSTRIRIRYLPGIEPAMRAVYKTLVYDIVAVLDPDGRGREMHLMCKAVV